MCLFTWYKDKTVTDATTCRPPRLFVSLYTVCIFCKVINSKLRLLTQTYVQTKKMALKQLDEYKYHTCGSHPTRFHKFVQNCISDAQLAW
jgi:hypothetical protein